MSATKSRNSLDRHFAVAGGALRADIPCRISPPPALSRCRARRPTPARRWGNEAGNHAHGRGLAGAVGAQESQHFAGCHRKGQIIDGQLVAVAFGQIFYCDHWRLGALIVAGGSLKIYSCSGAAALCRGRGHRAGPMGCRPSFRWPTLFSFRIRRTSGKLGRSAMRAISSGSSNHLRPHCTKRAASAIT